MSQARGGGIPLPSRQNTGEVATPTSPLATNNPTNQDPQEVQDQITQAPPRNT
jgi:hypothetical protein